MIEYCHYVKADKKWHFIPGCAGGACNGPEHCTCKTTADVVKKLETTITRRVDELSRTVAALEAFIEEQFKVDDGTKPVIVEFDREAARKREAERGVARLLTDFYESEQS